MDGVTALLDLIRKQEQETPRLAEILIQRQQELKQAEADVFVNDHKLRDNYFLLQHHLQAGVEIDATKLNDKE
jgi:hypothetical protein